MYDKNQIKLLSKEEVEKFSQEVNNSQIDKNNVITKEEIPSKIEKDNLSEDTTYNQIHAEQKDIISSEEVVPSNLVEDNLPEKITNEKIQDNKVTENKYSTKSIVITLIASLLVLYAGFYTIYYVFIVPENVNEVSN